MGFVHLHTHSEYSLLDGANRIPDLVARVSSLGMDSLAITDHGNLHAAWSFYEAAKKAKVKLTQSQHYDYVPIIDRKPFKLPKGARVAVMPYMNIEHL